MAIYCVSFELIFFSFFLFCASIRLVLYWASVAPKFLRYTVDWNFLYIKVFGFLLKSTISEVKYLQRGVLEKITFPTSLTSRGHPQHLPKKAEITTTDNLQEGEKLNNFFKINISSLRLQV